MSSGRHYRDAELSDGESTLAIAAYGRVGVTISGLSAGTVQLEVKFRSAETGWTDWMDFPGEDATFTEDASKIVLVEEDGVLLRLKSESATDGVYCRLARGFTTA